MSQTVSDTLKADARGRFGRLSQFDPKQKFMTDRYQKGRLTPIRIRGGSRRGSGAELVLLQSLELAIGACSSV